MTEEEKRFEKHGFDKKLRQSYVARLLGFFFYLIVFFVVVEIAKP